MSGKKKVIAVIAGAVMLCIVAVCILTVGKKGGWGLAAQLKMGEKYIEELQYEQAIAAYEAAIEIDPKCEEAYLKLAEIYLAMDKPEEAVGILSRGQENLPDSSAISEMLEEARRLDAEDEEYAAGGNSKDGSSEGAEEGGSSQEAEDSGHMAGDPDSDAVITAMEESIPAQYDFAAPFYDGCARVGRLQEDGSMKYFFINEKGETISREYDVALDFFGGWAIVGDADEDESWRFRYGYIDATGAEVIPATYLGDGSGVRCHYFYDGLAEVAWYGEDGWIYTNLIDEAGNKQLPFDIVRGDSREYGGGIDDPRILYLTSERSYASDGWYLFSRWNPLQSIRCGEGGSYPVQVSDGFTTYWLDEKWNIVRSQEGYRTSAYDYERGDEGLEAYDFIYPSIWEQSGGRLVDQEGNTVAENVDYAESGLGGRLILSYGQEAQDGSIKTMHYLCSAEGQRISDDYAALSTWESGYIISKEASPSWDVNGIYSVTDAELNELFTVEATYLYQMDDYVYDAAADSYDRVYLPLFRRSYVVNDGTANRSCYEYLDLEGQIRFPYEEGSWVTMLAPKYLIWSRGTGTEIYSMDGQLMTSLPDTRNFGKVFTEDQNEDIFSYERKAEGTEGAGTTVYVRMVEQDGSLEFVEVDYDSSTGGIGTSGTKKAEGILAENSISALWGLDDWETVPITLRRGTEVIAEGPALSLIGNNLYKSGANVDSLDWGEGRASDISLHTVDSSWQSQVYDDMGILSCNHISFCRDGKWGYLRAVQ